MQGPILIFLLIVVISAVIGAVSQVLKNAAQQPPPPRPKPRAAAGGVRPASGDIDRFLEEIDRLRKKKEGGGEPGRAEPPVAKPVARPIRAEAAPLPKAEPRRPKRRPEPSAKAEPRQPMPESRLRELPVAPPVAVTAPSPRATAVPYRPVVTAPLQLAAPLRATGAGPVVTQAPRQAPKSEFGRQLASLITSSKSMPLAVVLAEVLGPPKCRQG